jgi:RHS repeat-associated protein
VNYDYLTTGEVSKVRENGATTGIGVLATYGYDDTGNRTSLTYGNGVVQTYGYDPVSRLTALTTNLTDTNDLTIGGSTTPIAYNPASQIVSAPRSNDTFSWNGSVAVNRAYTANGLNQYTAAGAASFTYDAKGNLTSDGTNTYGYSSENLLTSAPGATLGYDPFLRLYQVAGSTTTRFAYDGLNIVADYDGAGVLQHRYVFGPGIDQPIVEYAGSGTTARTFLSADERGSIIARSGSTGALAAANTYDEYGIPGSGNAGLFQYTGQAWIGQLGFYYYKARMYSPTLGRFMQTDPLGYGGDGPNLYAYVLNDPVNFDDPMGLQQAITVIACRSGDSDIGSGGFLVCVKNDFSGEGAAEPTPGGNVDREGVGRPDRQQKESPSCQNLENQLKAAQKAYANTGDPMGSYLNWPTTWDNPRALQAELDRATADLAADELAAPVVDFFDGSGYSGIQAVRGARKVVKEGVSGRAVAREILGPTGLPLTAAITFVGVVFDSQTATLSAKVNLINLRLKQLQAQKAGSCPTSANGS